MTRGASGIWLRAGVPARSGLPRRGLPPGRLPRFPPGARLARANWRACEQRWSGAGGRRRRVGRYPAGAAGRRARRVRAQLLEAVFRAARATSTTGKWRQRAVSSWGFLLYSAFCLSTARLLAETPPKQTAQSEQRQDTGMAADLLRTGWGRRCSSWRGSSSWRAAWRRPPGGPARFPGAVHRRAHVPGAGHGHAGPRRVRLRRTRCRICPDRCLSDQGPARGPVPRPDTRAISHHCRGVTGRRAARQWRGRGEGT